MSVIEQEIPCHIDPPDISHIITEDDEPVDNIFSAKQQRLLVEPLYSSWRPEISFVADANVGVFSAIHRPPIVPDMFLSLDVALADDLYAKENRTYFIWEFGKPPDVAIEIVSNRKGGEADRKFAEYARIRVTYYVIYDPLRQIQSAPLQVYELNSGQYILRPDNWLPQVDLGLMLWEGAFEGEQAQWLIIVGGGIYGCSVAHELAPTTRRRCPAAGCWKRKPLPAARPAGWASVACAPMAATCANSPSCAWPMRFGPPSTK